ncbi:hypothetical protein O4G76_21340, partial [Limimaricola sp. G21655-S1]|uniref:hypothetical protein n=1 Tax=Limimaricola sp. G21655-S1 TaxID=3014768 RepID=UPI0022AFD876
DTGWRRARWLLLFARSSQRATYWYLFVQFAAVSGPILYAAKAGEDFWLLSVFHPDEHWLEWRKLPLA